MPRINKRKPTGNFDSFFDEELEELDTPADTIDSIPSEVDLEIDTAEQKEEDITTVSPSKEVDRFGLNKKNKASGSELIARTFKYDKETLKRVESLIYKDQKHSNKIPGPKGFISDFMENAIWQHLYQLGLATEEEVNDHLKSYSKYPLNFDNIEEK